MKKCDIANDFIREKYRKREYKEIEKVTNFLGTQKRSVGSRFGFMKKPSATTS